MTVQISAERAEVFSANGNTFRVIDDGRASDGRTAVFECEVDPGWLGPPEHVHREHDETVFVMSGSLRFTSRKQSFIAGPGQLVTIPMGDPHTFGNADPDAPARALCTVSPARYFDFFRDLSALPLNADGRAEPADIMTVMSRHATEPHF